MENVTIRGDEWHADYVISMLRSMQHGEFRKTTWSPRDALMAKDGSRATIYTGQKYDADEMILKKNYWDHDHCEVCNWLLIDTEGEDHRTGYFNEYNWLCEECYRLFIEEKRLIWEKER